MFLIFEIRRVPFQVEQYDNLVNFQLDFENLSNGPSLAF